MPSLHDAAEASTYAQGIREDLGVRILQPDEDIGESNRLFLIMKINYRIITNNNNNNNNNASHIGADIMIQSHCMSSRDECRTIRKH